MVPTQLQGALGKVEKHRPFWWALSLTWWLRPLSYLVIMFLNFILFCVLYCPMFLFRYNKMFRSQLRDSGGQKFRSQRFAQSLGSSCGFLMNFQTCLSQIVWTRISKQRGACVNNQKHSQPQDAIMEGKLVGGRKDKVNSQNSIPLPSGLPRVNQFVD